MIPAALIPLGALIVTEGFCGGMPRARPRSRSLPRHRARPCRRHWVGALRRAFAILLVLFQLGGFAICAWLLATRDRTTLMASENRSIGRLAVGAVLVIPSSSPISGC